MIKYPVVATMLASLILDGKAKFSDIAYFMKDDVKQVLINMGRPELAQ